MNAIRLKHRPAPGPVALGTLAPGTPFVFPDVLANPADDHVYVVLKGNDRLDSGSGVPAAHLLSGKLMIFFSGGSVVPVYLTGTFSLFPPDDQ